MNKPSHTETVEKLEKVIDSCETFYHTQVTLKMLRRLRDSEYWSDHCPYALKCFRYDQLRSAYVQKRDRILWGR